MHVPQNKKDKGEKLQTGNSIQGRYANFYEIGFNAFEFVFDFGQTFSENEEAELSTRIILPPILAKSLFDILQESIDSYDVKFGHICNIHATDTQEPDWLGTPLNMGEPDLWRAWPEKLKTVPAGAYSEHHGM